MQVLNKRAAGILLAVSSLPSPCGIGSFGEQAREWLRFLKAAGQKYWQILPLGPTSWGDSPYQSFSAFALSSYYIDLDTLIEQGLLLKNEVYAIKTAYTCAIGDIKTSPISEVYGTSPAAMRWGKRADTVDYAIQYRRRESILRMACERFKVLTAADAAIAAAFSTFCDHNKFWLEDYSLFMALKKKHRGRPWLDWDEPLKKREKSGMQKIKLKLAEDINYHSFVQYTAYTQWQGIRDYGTSLGIAIIGDMPIYVAIDSADAWANSDLFLLDEARRPIRVAGCPPDPFSASGQLWGNPLYRWDYIAETDFAWWIARLRFSLALYDVVRIDHFRGFESFFSIDAQAHDARGGEWVRGPGLAFIEALHRDLPGAAIIAEDLGYLTDEVKALLKASGYPGMKILQFAFDSREASDYMPHTFERNCVVYTGTHDNPTSLGWFATAPLKDVDLAMDYFGIYSNKEANWAFIRCALASIANTAIIPMQDYLGLDNRARMNTPSTLGGNNWRWRIMPGAASQDLAEKIHRLTSIYGR